MLGACPSFFRLTSLPPHAPRFSIQLAAAANYEWADGCGERYGALSAACSG